MTANVGEDVGEGEPFLIIRESVNDVSTIETGREALKKESENRTAI